MLVLLLGAVAPRRELEAQAACNGGPACTVVVSLQLERPYVASLELSQSVTTISSVTATELSTGFTDHAGPQLRVKANAPYRITVQAAQDRWLYNGGAAGPQKPAADLQWSGTATGPWTSSAVSAGLWPRSAAAAPATAGVTIPVFYRIQWDWAASLPGTYTIPVNFTLTSP